jgi:hypothetical protein
MKLRECKAMDVVEDIHGERFLILRDKGQDVCDDFCSGQNYNSFSMTYQIVWPLSHRQRLTLVSHLVPVGGQQDVR